jgi:hypothetical protein
MASGFRSRVRPGAGRLPGRQRLRGAVAHFDVLVSDLADAHVPVPTSGGVFLASMSLPGLARW